MGTNNIWICLISLILISSACVQASKSPFSLTAPNTTIVSEPSKNVNIAKQQLIANAKTYQIDLTDINLRYISETTDAAGNIHLKLQPEIRHVPLWSKEIIVHLNQNGLIYAVSGNLPKRPLLSTRAIIEKKQAEKTALDSVSGQPSSKTIQNTELVLYPNDRKDLFELAYKVTVFVGLMRYFILVSAINGDVLHKFSNPTRLQ